jgi:hypothetical protein
VGAPEGEQGAADGKETFGDRSRRARQHGRDVAGGSERIASGEVESFFTRDSFRRASVSSHS